MRSVWILPSLPREEVEARLDRIGLRRELSGSDVDWVVSGGLFVDLQTSELFEGWQEEAIAEIGGRPSWGLLVKVADLLAGYDELVALLEVLIGSGGYAIDSGPGVWTFEDIRYDAWRPDGRRFFE